MCGIAGLFQPDRRPDAPLDDIARRMGAAIRHRGPDSDGVWQDESAGYAVSQQRLAIIDLSPAGHQPMVSRSGRYVVAYNGEVYNFTKLREKLDAEQAVDWRGHSDTEVLLEAVERWGIDRALEHSAGMFALALWDRHERALTLARDRFGKKPLYVGWLPGGGVVYGSELKALTQHPQFNGEVNREVLCRYLRRRCVGGLRAIYRDVYKVAPGSVITLDAKACAAAPDEPAFDQACKRFWSPQEMYDAPAFDFERYSETDALDQLEAHLRLAVEERMIADVPLGAFLSGGIDSSLVVAEMQALSSSPVRTFTIGFDDKRFDESRHAQAVADHLKTDHTEFRVTGQDALDVLPLLPQMFCEPFADASQIPTYLVSKLARQHVTVALTGDGGDEGFAGYPHYTLAPKSAKLLAAPHLLRQPAGWLMETLGSPASAAACALWPRTRNSPPLNKIIKGVDLLNAPHFGYTHRALMTACRRPERMLAFDAHEPAPPCPADGEDRVKWMMMRDVVEFIADDSTVKVDRASMAVSLETRSPMLDHRLMAFGWSLPSSMLIREGQGKWPLRQLLYRHVPRAIIDRPKKGFSIPIGRWLREDLRDWADHLLGRERLADQGLFNPTYIRKVWDQHQSGVRRGQDELWAILMFQQWLDHQDSPAS
ncbi:asparagine synthase (glutamine-hydrolyzing) [Phycisphaeraceae bacterium D3-23]